MGKIEKFGSVKESLQDLFTTTLEFARIYVWSLHHLGFFIYPDYYFKSFTEILQFY